MEIHRISPEEIEIFNRGVSDPNITLGYLLKRPGTDKTFQLDFNFTEKGRWQKSFCMASQTFIVVIAGIGTGKTLAAGMSAFYHAIMTPGFKFLNIARESWQSQLMYQLILENLEGTIAQKFVTATPKRPYPSIVIEYLVGERRIKSTLEFMSLGEQGDATNVFSWRGDWINLEEAGRIEGLSTIVSNLSTRLTGSTSEGRPFMGRMSLISNPWDNIDLWSMLDQAQSDTKNGLAMEIETKENMNVTEGQLERMLALIPESERARYTTGKRPDARGTYFPREIVEKCEDIVLSESLAGGVTRGYPGFVAKHRPRLGYYHFEVPPVEGRIYYVIGDPGIDNAPKRNAPVWMVFDVTDAPRYVPVVALWWGSGDGSIMPFIDTMLALVTKYKPVFCAMDNTATQKNMAEVVNMEHVSGKGYSVEKIYGFDFSGAKRYSYLICLKMAIETATIKWPSNVIAIGSQLGNYDPTLDKSATAKLPQDIVATMSMAAFKIRTSFGFNSSESVQGDPSAVRSPEVALRAGREYNSFYRDQKRTRNTKHVKRLPLS